jgi:hypothetical protein
MDVKVPVTVSDIQMHQFNWEDNARYQSFVCVCARARANACARVCVCVGGGGWGGGLVVS